MTVVKSPKSPGPSCQQLLSKRPKCGVFCKGPENIKKPCQLCLQNLSQICSLVTFSSSASTWPCPIITSPGQCTPTLTPQSVLTPKPEGACEHLTQVSSLLSPQPFWATHGPWGKSPGPPPAHELLHNLPHPLPALASSLTCSSHTGLLTIAPTNQAWSCFRTFALAVPSAWISLPPDLMLTTLLG